MLRVYFIFSDNFFFVSILKLYFFKILGKEDKIKIFVRVKERQWRNILDFSRLNMELC